MVIILFPTDDVCSNDDKDACNGDGFGEYLPNEILKSSHIMIL